MDAGCVDDPFEAAAGGLGDEVDHCAYRGAEEEQNMSVLDLSRSGLPKNGR